MRKISNSQISMWMRCPRQWEFRYVKGLKIPPKGIMVQGSAYHGALSENFKYKIVKKEDLDLRDLIDAYDTYWNKSIKGDYAEKDEEIDPADKVDWEDDKPEEVKAEGFKMVQLYHERYASKIIPVEVEQEATKQINDDVTLHGFIDLFTGKKIIDHKLKSRAMSDADAAQDSQAFTYCFLKGIPDFEFHCAVKRRVNPDIVIVPVKKSADEINWWLESVVLICRQIDTGIAPPNYKGWHCSEKFCGYWDDCQKMHQDIFIFGEGKKKKKGKKK